MKSNFCKNVFCCPPSCPTRCASNQSTPTSMCLAWLKSNLLFHSKIKYTHLNAMHFYLYWQCVKVHLTLFSVKAREVGRLGLWGMLCVRSTSIQKLFFWVSSDLVWFPALHVNAGIFMHSMFVGKIRCWRPLILLFRHRLQHWNVCCGGSWHAEEGILVFTQGRGPQCAFLSSIKVDKR